jgi:hypothetical protein
MYSTVEPLCYYSGSRDTPQNILIVENKDPFFSIRKLLISNGEADILGTRISTVVYGAGKGILKSFGDYELCIEPYMKAEGCRMFYWGDLDYEGIGIAQSFSQRVSEYDDAPALRLFVPAYERMVQKAAESGFENLPDTKEGQNRNIDYAFFEAFTKDIGDRMRTILESGRYIPQEIINVSDFGYISQIRDCGP